MRHKRQALQDMARPLKQWLYKHRDNPYPTKTEKILLALGSQMTLVQVSPAPGGLRQIVDRMRLGRKVRTFVICDQRGEKGGVCSLWLRCCLIGFEKQDF